MKNSEFELFFAYRAAYKKKKEMEEGTITKKELQEILQNTKELHFRGNISPEQGKKVIAFVEKFETKYLGRREDEIKALVEKTRNSSFNRDNYAVNIDLSHFVYSMLLYTHYELIETMDDTRDRDTIIEPKNWLMEVTPKFQRDNDKWTREMQISFVENLFNGAKTELLLYKMTNSGNSKIIDGLQRTTAILQFLSGAFRIFESENDLGYSFKEVRSIVRGFRINLVLRIYTFKSLQEVGQFYIDMNENITHSKEDIEKAVRWFSEQGVKLHTKGLSSS